MPSMSRYTKILTALLFLALVVLSLSLTFADAPAQTTISSSQIRNEAIHGYHLDDSLRAVMVFEVSDSTVWYARYARGIVDGTIQWSDLSSGLQDSLRGTGSVRLISVADTARFAKALATGTISDTSMFSQGVRDLLTGRILGSPWIHLSSNALTASMALYATDAAHATFADSSGKAPSSAVADSAGVAGYAYLAGAVLVEEGTVLWSSLDATVQDSIYLAPHYADSAGKVVAGGINDIGQFGSTITSGYLPTAGEKLGLKGTTTWGAAVAAGNRVVDSTSAANRFVIKEQTDKLPRIDYGTRATVGDAAYEIGVDTAASVGKVKLVINKGADVADVGVFEDSIAIHTAINDTIADAVLKGNGLWQKVFMQSATPSGVLGYVWIDTTGGDTAVMNWYDGGAWWPVGGAGGAGAGAASALATDWYGNVDADCVAFRDAESTYFPHFLLVDTLYPYTNASSVLGKNGTNEWRNVITQIISCDTLSSTDYAPSGGGGPGNIYVSGKLRFNGSGSIIGDPDTSTYSPMVYAKRIEVYQAVSTDDSSKIILSQSGSVLPTATYISPGRNRWGVLGGTNSKWLAAMLAESLTVYSGEAGEPKIKLWSDAARGITVTDGNIVATGSGGTISGNTGSFGTSQGTNSNFTSYFVSGVAHELVTVSQSAALDSACDASGDNPFITREWQKRQAAAYYGPIEQDTAFAYWHLWYRYVTTLFNDSFPCDSGEYEDPSEYNPNINPSMIEPVVIDTGWTPIDPTRWPTPGIGGMVVVDTAITGNDTCAPLAMDWQNPFLSRKFIVADGYDDNLGRYTGYFGTIQGALNNIPNVVCLMTEAANSNDTLIISTTTNSRKLRYGTTVVDTVTSIPAMFKTAGAWLLNDKDAVDSIQVWVTVNRILGGDSIVLSDPTPYDDATYTNQDAILSLPWTIEVWPRTDGAMWQLTDSCVIPSLAPVTIKGIGKETVISNIASGGFSLTTSSPTIFSYPNAGGHAGLPIEIRDMSIVSAYGTRSTSVLDFRGGEITLANINAQFSADANASFIYYFQDADHASRTPFRGSLVIDHCAIAADSDCYVIDISGGNPCRIQSKDNEYSIGGSGGGILKAGSISAIPQFFRDIVFTDPTRSAGVTYNATDSQVSDSILIVQCVFTGRVPAYDGANWLTAYTGGSNTIQSAITEPPVRVVESRKLFKDNQISPKY